MTLLRFVCYAFVMKDVLLVLLIVLLIGTGAYSAFNSDNPVITDKDLISAVNDARAAHNAPPLVLDSRLQDSARKKAEDMLQYQYYEHANPDTGYRGLYYMYDANRGVCRTGAENLIRNVVSAEEAVNEWLESPSHREAMLDSVYDLTGFAIVPDLRYADSYMIVQHFCELS